MKRFTILSLALAGVLVAAAAGWAQEKPKDPQKEPPKETPKVAAKIDVTGAWDCSVDTPQGTRDSVITFKQDGGKLTGTMASEMGELALAGTIKDAEVAFAIVLDMQGQQITISYSGKVDGESMSGTIEFGSYGSSTWSAKKKKS